MKRMEQGLEIILFIILTGAFLVFVGQSATNGTFLSVASNAASTAFSGGKLTSQQIAAYAQQAGFSGGDLVIAVAVALAESKGDPNAYDPETAARAPQGMGSYGLWQIYLKAHPEFSSYNLYDPQQNADAALQVWASAGGSWSPWTTFTSGEYLAFLDTANQAVNA